MRFLSLTDACGNARVTKAKGPVAIIIAEDDAEIPATIEHHVSLGFRTVCLVGPPELARYNTAELIQIDFPTMELQATETIVNTLAGALPERTWLYYCYNAEFLFYPFSESRTIGEMLTFHAEERRFSMLTYVIDVYARDLSQADNAVSLKDAHLDRSGYYALSRHGSNGQMDRQLDFYGGLRWRFEEHIDEAKRKIDRMSLVRTKPGLDLRGDHTWSEDELNTYSCPWHHNLTAAIVSFRTAKALRSNPASRFDISTFHWYNSVPFEWKSQQLLDLGLMEPGQWF